MLMGEILMLLAEKRSLPTLDCDCIGVFLFLNRAYSWCMDEGTPSFVDLQPWRFRILIDIRIVLLIVFYGGCDFTGWPVDTEMMIIWTIIFMILGHWSMLPLLVCCFRVIPTRSGVGWLSVVVLVRFSELILFGLDYVCVKILAN